MKKTNRQDAKGATLETAKTGKKLRASASCKPFIFFLSDFGDKLVEKALYLSCAGFSFMHSFTP